MNADRKSRWRDWLGAALVIVLIPVLLLLLPVVLLWLLGILFAKIVLLTAAWILWLPRGKDTLIVYSRSPHWMEYFENELIPQLERRAVVLNWSDRAQWSPFALRTLLFRAFKGERAFNPTILIFRPLRWPKFFRFYDCFKQRKHGNDQPLYDLEMKLAPYLANA